MREVEVAQENEVAELALKRLIAEQRVTPIDDLDHLASLWPADDELHSVRTAGPIQRDLRR